MTPTSAETLFDLPAGFGLAAGADADAQALLARLDATLAHETVVVDGCPVVFRRAGEGPPLLLLHGGHGSWMHWVRVLSPLARHHTLWIADMPGYGDSGVPAGEASLDLLIRTLGAALDQLLGADTLLDIAGFSFGGLCAATLAAGRPAVRRVGLLAPAGHGQPRRMRMPLRNWKPEPPGDVRDAVLRHNLAALMMHKGADTDALALAIHRSACVATRFRSRDLAMGAGLQLALATLSQRGIPVLAAWGEHDVTAFPAATGATLAAGATTVRWQVIPDAGHWTQYEAPDVTARLLDDWFQSDTTSGQGG